MKVGGAKLSEFLKEFGINPNAELRQVSLPLTFTFNGRVVFDRKGKIRVSDSSFYRGTVLTKGEVSQKLKKLGLLRFGSFLFGWGTFWVADSYYEAYYFERMIDGKYRLCWYDRLGYL